ncbi:MAG: triose-phosphate isomerase [Bacillales bacterium]
MRRKLLIGNWKMNKTLPESIEFAKNSINIAKLAKSKKIDLGIAVPYISLHSVKKIIKKKMIVASQNVSQFEKGAYTGEVSIPMLASIDIDSAIIGHSERRTYDNETSEKCNAKILALLKNNMTPIYCCGESLEVFEANKTKQHIKDQILIGLKDVQPEDMKKVVIAYEPIWSIGTGKNASSEIAEDICAYIRKLIRKEYGAKIANKVRILYGGSVKPNNIHQYLENKNIDGALVGGASLEISSFEQLVENI